MGTLSRVRLGIALLAAVFTSIGFATSAHAAVYKLPPTGQDQWYWEISPSQPGLAGLPSTSGSYPAPGSANIWDTDLFQDSNTASAGIPTGPSPVVQALHASGKYSICYVEVGAYQQGFPDNSNFAAADYGNGASQYGMQGWPGEWWFDISGFANYVAGNPSTLTGAAVNIAAGLDKRIGWCALEGQDAVEPDDLDGYTNPGDTGVAGGGWGLTQADAAGFERWLAYDAHSEGLAIFQKNDPANAAADEPLFDGMVIEECNHFNDPCAGSGGDATAYLKAGKPVLNAEYTSDGETTSKFCSADVADGITGALFDLNLDGQTYQPCAAVGATSPGGTGTGGGTGSGTGGSGGGTGGSGGSGGSGGGGSSTSGPAPASTRKPVLSGTAKQGDQLKVSNGSWSGSPQSYSYAWQRCRRAFCMVVKNATKQAYVLGAADVGYQLIAAVTAKNAAGSASAASARSAVVATRSVRARTARRHKRKHRRSVRVKKHRRVLRARVALSGPTD